MNKLAYNLNYRSKYHLVNILLLLNICKYMYINNNNLIA